MRESSTVDLDGMRERGCAPYSDHVFPSKQLLHKIEICTNVAINTKYELIIEYDY